MLRPYQVESIDQIRHHFGTGTKRVLLWLPTGAGKTVVFCEIIKNAEKRGKKTMVVVRGRELVNQASKRLIREGVFHGVLMNNHWNRRPGAPHQVASIDTLIARDLKPDVDIVIVDEAHLFSPRSKAGQFLANYSDKFMLPVTATPYVSDGLKHLADAIVHPVTMLQLIEQGYLAPFRYFAPAAPDLSDVKVSSSTNDYVNDQLEDAMVAGGLTGKIIDHWLKLAKDRPTICFSVNIHHSKFLVNKFMEAGIAAEHCDADTDDEERIEIIKRLERGETKIVCNVGILCTGVDIPCLSAIILARPTKSKNLFIQQCGRGTRTFQNKANCILLDHSGNIVRHGLPTDETPVSLDGKVLNEKPIRFAKTCDDCFAVFLGQFCPECGIAVPDKDPIDIEIEESNDQLTELLNVELDPILRAYKSLQAEAKRTGRKPGWANYRLIQRFGFEHARSYLPEWFVARYQAATPERSPFSGSPFVGVKPS